MTKLKQPIKWHGGKHYLAPKLIELMPDHTRYLEPFAGGLSVLLCKPCEGIAEWVNDTNQWLCNFWAVMAREELFQQFARAIEATLLNEWDFRHSREIMKGPLNGQYVGDAIAFFINARMSRQGLGKDYCTPTRRTRRGMNENVSAWLTAVDGLADVHQRLRRVEVWNRSAIDAIKKLDGPDLLVYGDPPYLHGTRNSTGEYGEHEMSHDDHAELLGVLASMEGKFILSGYRSSLYDDIAETFNWRRVDFDLPNNASSKKTKERKTESVWMNY